MTEYAELPERVREAKEILRERSARDLAESLGRVGRRFLDPDDPLRSAALERIPEETGHTPAVSEAIVDGMARDWVPDRLQRLLAAEFPDPSALDGFREGPEGSRLFATGGRLAFHLGSGNVPGVGATSIIRSLLVKCPVVLKPGRGDRALPSLFARGLAELDPELARALAVVYWPRGAGGELEERLLAATDRVVVYGGTDVVAELRRRLPSTTPLVAYHHRVSVGAVARECLSTEASADEVAASAAGAVAAYDRRGCVSPRVIWVEEGGGLEPLEWAERLAGRMELVDAELPAPDPDPSEAASLRQLEGTLELARAAGKPVRLFSGPAGRWAVVFGPAGEVSDPWPGRTVQVRPISTLEALGDELRPISRYLQTIALAATRDRREVLASRLSESGLVRITTFEAQPWPPPWWHHDGRGPLQALVRWVELEP